MEDLSEKIDYNPYSIISPMGGEKAGERIREHSSSKNMYVTNEYIKIEEFQENRKLYKHTNLRASRYAFVAYFGDHSISFSLNLREQCLEINRNSAMEKSKFWII